MLLVCRQILKTVISEGLSISVRTSLRINIRTGERLSMSGDKSMDRYKKR